jgi:hypothetical protein
MQMWGLSLDMITCVALQMAVGLCVDYAAHIGHTFLSINGKTKNERALETIKYIGPAVIYGGTSTVLVFSALGTIESYAYIAFFRVNENLGIHVDERIYDFCFARYFHWWCLLGFSMAWCCCPLF